MIYQLQNDSKAIAKNLDSDVVQRQTVDSFQAVEFSSVHRRYANQRGIGPVTLNIPWKSVCSLIGANGSGKTTLLRCAAQFETLDEGEIKIDGRVSAVSQSNSARSKIDFNIFRGLILGVVAQNAEPWMRLSVLDNIMLPLLKVARLSKTDAQERAETELARFSLSDRAKAMPYQLSGGLQQRVTLARAFALRPRILLLDEVTSALDPDWTERVRLIIRDFADTGGAVISVSHKMNLVRRMSDYVVYLSDGRIVEEGQPQSVLDFPQNAELCKFLKNS